jgi:pimeloyl-ACP methyl ester carboxylesterase
MSAVSKATTVLIPGLTCDETYWAHQSDVLLQRGTVVIPRLHDLNSIADMAASVLDLVSGPLDVVGHSMGGRVAFEIARMAPEKVRSLAVFDTGVHPVSDGEPASRQVRLDIAATQGMAGLASDWVPMMVHPDRRDDTELVASITSMVIRFSFEQYRRQIQALLARPDARPVLATIECPTLVSCGRADSWSPVEQHIEFAAQIRGARLEIIGDAGHMVSMERPEETTSLLSRWLDDVDRAHG